MDERLTRRKRTINALISAAGTLEMCYHNDSVADEIVECHEAAAFLEGLPEDMTFSALRELVRAQAEGRVVMLPEGHDEAKRLFAQDLSAYEMHIKAPPELFYKNEAEKYACMRSWRFRADYLKAILSCEKAVDALEAKEEDPS